MTPHSDPTGAVEIGDAREDLVLTPVTATIASDTPREAIARAIDTFAFSWPETPWGPLVAVYDGTPKRWSRIMPAIAAHRDEGESRRKRALATADTVLALRPQGRAGSPAYSPEAVQALIEACEPFAADARGDFRALASALAKIKSAAP